MLSSNQWHRNGMQTVMMPQQRQHRAADMLFRVSRSAAGSLSTSYRQLRGKGMGKGERKVVRTSKTYHCAELPSAVTWVLVRWLQ